MQIVMKTVQLRLATYWIGLQWNFLHIPINQTSQEQHLKYFLVKLGSNLLLAMNIERAMRC